MHPATAEGPPFRRLIARQSGLISVQQALALGHTPSSIKRRVALRRWTRPLPGVLLTAPLTLTPELKVMAAVLWAGLGAVPMLSRDGSTWRLVDVGDQRTPPAAAAVDAATACWLFGFRTVQRPPAAVQIVVGHDSPLRSHGFVTVRKTVHPIPMSTVSLRWVPTLPVADAAVAAAARLVPSEAATALLAEAVRRAHGRSAPLLDALTRAPRRAAGKLDVAAEPLINGTQTLGEARFRALAQARPDLPELRYNWLLELPCGRRVAPDALAPDAPLIHEVNGYEVHAAVSDDFTSFQARHDAVVVAGLTVLHNSPERIRTHGDAAVGEFATMHSQLRGQGYPPGVRILRAGPPT